MVALIDDNPPSTRKVHSTGYANYVLGLLFISYAFSFMDRNILSILLEPIKAELKVSDTWMGLLTGFAFVAFYSAFGIPIARWADRGNRRSILALGMTLWCVMTALSGLAQSFWQLALARVGVGVGEAAGGPPAHSLISDYFSKEKRPRALAVFQSGIYVGLLFGYVMGGWIAELYGWRTAFWVAGIPGLLVALLIRFTVHEPERGASDPSHSDKSPELLGNVVRFLITQKSYLLLVLGVGLVAFTNYSISVWAPAFLRRVHHMSSGEIGSYLGPIKGVAGLAGTLLGGFVVERIQRHGDRWALFLPAVATLLGVPAVALFLFAEVSWGFLALALGTLLLGFHLGPCFAMAQSLVKVRMRSVSASILFMSISLIGLGCGPFIAGLLNDLLRDQLGALSIRYSLTLSLIGSVLGSWCFLSAGRSVAADLRRVEQ